MNNTRRRICYVSGTRADFGLMTSTLHRIRTHPALQLQLMVTGMHLSPHYGVTVSEIEAEGFDILARVPCEMEGDASGAQMARNIGRMLQGFVDALESQRPDLLLVLGDRGEMLAGALAGAHLGIPVAHLHGGERSGTVDEPVRHAISKLSHLHLVATEEARDRLIRMGELGQHVRVSGAPGLDGLTSMALAPRQALCAEEGLNPQGRLALLVYHPVLQEADVAGAQAEAILAALEAADFQVLALMPNSDAGSAAVRTALLARQRIGRVIVKTHLPRSSFVAWMAAADVMVGNSSSGIIEAGSFGTPVINLGSRQNRRERNSNVLDLPIDRQVLFDALERLVTQPRPVPSNCYGDGHAGERIADWLAGCELSAGLLAKCNAY